MPEITQDERGRRVFQIQRERAIENAINRIRTNMGQDWMLLSANDIDNLKYILGEAWIAAGREDWKGIVFSRLGIKEIQKIIDTGKELKTESRMRGDVLNTVINILKGT